MGSSRETTIMNKKIIASAAILIIIALGIEFFFSSKKPKLNTENPVIGIIIPLTHPAINKIVDGFCKELNQLTGKKCSYLIKDAQGDQNVQQPAIIDEMKRKNVDIIVPIGTLCTQMAIQKAPEIPVVALAASQKCIQSSTNMATGVHDEIEAKDSFAMIENIIPKISKIALIATQNEKTFPEVQVFRAEALNKGVAVQTIFVQSSSEIYLAAHSIDADAQAIHVLKDHLIVNSIATINQIARDRKIPVIASDEGSVEEGAACALGVEETTIGKAGAHLALKILTGTPPQEIAVKRLEEHVIFINTLACTEQNIHLSNIKKYAHAQKLKIIEVSTSSHKVQS